MIAGSAGKVIVCTPKPTANARVTGLAAANTALPGCVAVSEQIPAAVRVTVAPETVQTAMEFEVRVTVRPEVAVAASPNGAVPKEVSAGCVNVIVCGPRFTVNVWLTGVATPKA